MKKDIFVIRGNITPTIERLERERIKREAQEKAEREAKWAKEREEREKKEAEWKKEHPILDKFTYISYHNFDTYSWPGDYCNIRFYEWSDINREPRFFSHTIGFYRFLDECKLNLTEAQNSKIKANMGCHITCIPGTHDLLIGPSYESLKSQFNMAMVLGPVPEVKGLPAAPKVLQCKVYEHEKGYA